MNRGLRPWGIGAGLVLAQGLGLDAAGQDGPHQEQDPHKTVVETKPAAPTGFPGSVRIITQEELRKETALSNDWGRILGKILPSMSLSTESLSNAGQTLRGGTLSIMIDGVPQSSPLRNAQRDLRIIDPSAVERIEIWNIPTSVYGYGATTGVINFITKKTGEGKPTFDTEVGAGCSLTHPDGSFRGGASQLIAAKYGPVGFAVGAALQTTDSFFDAEGQHLSPNPQVQGGLPDSDSRNLYGKIMVDLGHGQNVKLMANFFDTRQDTNFITVAGVPGIKKSRARRGVVPGLDPATENTVVSLSYENPDLAGSRLDTQLFYQDYATRFAFSPFFPGGGQSFVQSAKWGSRVLVDSPMPAPLDLRARWGADFMDDQTAQPLEDGRTYAPRMEQQELGLVVQLEARVGDQWILRGGVRQEFIDLRVAGFVTLFGGALVQGGRLAYEPTLWNAGFEFKASEAVTIFAGFAQSFSLADVGLDLQTTAGPSVRSLNPEGQRVDNYELGARVSWGAVGFSITFFYNESDDGITFGNPPAFLARRFPERIYGGEATLEIQPSEDWKAGVAAAWMEGERDSDKNGEFDTYLPSYRTPPFKLTAFAEHQTLPKWTNRIQVVYSANRDRFGGESANFGEGEVKDFVIVSLSSSVRLGEGVLRIGVENAFNEMYFPIVSQVANIGRLYTAGEGAVLRITYSLRY